VSLRGALVLVLPEPGLEALRARFDAKAVAAGIPLHVTLLFPFGLGESGLDELFARWSPLRFSLTRVETFPEAAVWLAPEPVEELRARILELYARYPQYPPYGGEFPDPVPHATVGQPADMAEAVREAAEPLLPVGFEVRAATLIEEVEPDRWRAGRSFPFEGMT
jgi:2'-5' RNA ligase